MAITGVIDTYVGITAPTGAVLAAGGTIGDTGSGATERANADTQALFLLLWDSLDDTQAPVFGGRGVNAAADFAAGKTIQLPDLRGRVVVGRDDLGGTAAGRITAASLDGVNASVQGGVFGAETNTLQANQLPDHYHVTRVGMTIQDGTNAAIPTGTEIDAGKTQSTGFRDYMTQAYTGGGSAVSNTQPSIALNKIIWL